MNFSRLRAGVVSLATIAGLLPTFGVGSAAAVPHLDSGTNQPALVAAAPVATDQLVAYRQALLAKASNAIEVRNATIKALHEQRVAELGYEPGTTDPREIARQIMTNKYSWGEDQFTCYNAIIMRESKWIVSADNPYSSAYGIPQALPGKRMAAFGADWRTNPATQIRWGLDYVNDRYGTPCQAWSFKRSHGWY